MTRSFDALERSLHEGPPDEGGYMAGAIRFGQEAASDPAMTVSQLERVRRADVGHQRRPMRPSMSLTTALALAVVLVFGGFGTLGVITRWGSIGQPTPYPLPSSSPDGSGIVVPSLTESFVSARNGFSVRYPIGWSVRSATTSWPLAIFLPHGNSALDELARPGDARFAAASQRLAPGQTEEEFLAAYAQPYPGARPCGVSPSEAARLPIDGHSGYLVSPGCPASADSKFSVPDIEFLALVIADGRVYQLSLDGKVDLAYFEAMLATVTLDPASAIDP